MRRHPISKSVLPLVFCTKLCSAEVLFVATPSHISSYSKTFSVMRNCLR